MKQYRYFRIIAVALIALILIISCIDLHICSDQHCLICTVLRPLMEQFYFVIHHWSIIGCMLVFLISAFAETLQVLRAPTLVMQKVKITC